MDKWEDAQVLYVPLRTAMLFMGSRFGTMDVRAPPVVALKPTRPLVLTSVGVCERRRR